MIKQELTRYMKEHKWSTMFFIFFGIYWSISLPLMSYLLGQIVDDLKSGAPVGEGLNKIGSGAKNQPTVYSSFPE